MSVIIIYIDDPTYVIKSIDSMLDHTISSDISEIIICDDHNFGITHDKATTLATNKIGKAQAWNNAAATTKSPHLIFLRDTTKFTNGWIKPLLHEIEQNETTIVSPITYELDPKLWSSKPEYISRPAYGADLKQYNRKTQNKETPTASNHALAITKDRFNYIGGFDENMKSGNAAILELSIRNWLFGGDIKITDDSIISTFGIEDINISDYARIIETWLPQLATSFYDIYKTSLLSQSIGKLDNLYKLKNKQQITAADYLARTMPELLAMVRTKGMAHGKSIAVVSDGPSLDNINPSLIYKHDIIISVDYVGSIIDSDYVLTKNAEILTTLREKYPDNKLILPISLESRATGRMIDTNEIAPGSIQYESNNEVWDNPNLTSYPPFANFGHSVHEAIHFAIHLGPSDITLYGADNKIIADRSHTSRISHYDDGKLWPDSESIRRRFAGFEYGLDRLGQLAASRNIPLLRMNHA